MENEDNASVERLAQRNSSHANVSANFSHMSYIKENSVVTQGNRHERKGKGMRAVGMLRQLAREWPSPHRNGKNYEQTVTTVFTEGTDGTGMLKWHSSSHFHCPKQQQRPTLLHETR